MDPQSNLTEQRELAAELGEALQDPDVDPERIREMADRLAELVAALDEWRLNGGYDPYLQGFEPTGDIEERMTFVQALRIRKLFNDFRARRAVLDVNAPGIPAGYLGLLVRPESGNTVEFGIDREGTASS